MKRAILFLFFSTYLVSCAQEVIVTTDKKNKIDQLFERWNKPNSPGMAIGIISNQKMIYTKGYGLSNLEHNISITSNTAFNIASNSKQFTAASIIILNLQGKIQLNQSVQDFFPDFPNYFNQVTINHLLHHTSGLRDFSQITYLSGLRPDDYYNNDDILQWIKKQQSLNFTPGDAYLYSNSNYWLLGQIVQKVSGISLAEYAEKEIFKPLKMENTRFVDNNSISINNRATGYSFRRNRGYRNIVSTLERTGNAGVYSTVNDLKKWTDAFFDKKVLNEQFWKLMTTKGTLNNGEKIDYACALEIQNYKGLQTIEHGGRTPGYLSDIIRFPEEKLAVIVLTNTGNTNATQLGYQIVDIMLKEKFKKKAVIKNNKKTKVITLSNKELQKFTGSYWNTVDAFSRKITIKNDTLHYMRSSRNSNILLPLSKNRFKMLNTPPGMDIQVKFSKGDNMTFIENGNEIVHFVKYSPVNYNNQALQNFTGVFFSEEIDTQYELKLHKNTLQLFINGRRSVPLNPVMNNLFNSPMALFKFKEVNGAIVELLVSTPRVKNLSFKRKR